MNDLLNTMLQASGGLERWQETKSIYFHGRIKGAMIFSKTALNWNLYSKGIKNRDIEVFVHEQKVIVHDLLSPDIKGIFENGNARIETTEGLIVSERKNARDYFYKNFGITKLFSWDILDFTYFIGYMFWNYFTAPFLFTHPGVISKEIAPIFNKKGEKFRVLEVVFPKNIPTHSTTQQYLVDDRGLNVEMRYQLDISGFLKLKFHNFITHYDNINGLQIPIQRRVFFNWDTFFRDKRKKNYSNSLPMWGKVHSVKLIKKSEIELKH